MTKYEFIAFIEDMYSFSSEIRLNKVTKAAFYSSNVKNFYNHYFHPKCVSDTWPKVPKVEETPHCVYLGLMTTISLTFQG